MWRQRPKQLPEHFSGTRVANLKASVEIGRFQAYKGDLPRVIHEMELLWPGSGYDLFKRNCNHFADALCVKLVGKHIPEWVNKAANAVGNGLDGDWTGGLQLLEGLANSLAPPRGTAADAPHAARPQAALSATATPARTQTNNYVY